MYELTPKDLRCKALLTKQPVPERLYHPTMHRAPCAENRFCKRWCDKASCMHYGGCTRSKL